MTAPTRRDKLILLDASRSLEEAIRRAGATDAVNAKPRILEGAAALIGGFDLKSFDLFVCNGNPQTSLEADATIDLARPLAKAVASTSIHPSLALAALGDADFTHIQRRRQGHFLTDSALALELATSVRDPLVRAQSVLDPACGAGTLLVAATLTATQDIQARAHFIGHAVWGVDCNPQAIRVTRAALASLTSDLCAVNRLSQHLLVADSLSAGWEWWNSLLPGGYDVVVGNPPWEKLKITRHEHALNSGHRRLYGEEYVSVGLDDATLRVDRKAALTYQRQIAASFEHQGQGEADLYKMFVELGAQLTSPSGTLALLIPAGFIRNSGTSHLRKWLFSNFESEILVMDNRHRYFEIDSRFKFLRLVARREESRNHKIEFTTVNSLKAEQSELISSTYDELRSLDQNITLPELRSRRDWDLFLRLSLSFKQFEDNAAGWQPRFYREVDMTNERSKFLDAVTLDEGLAVVEGRMVHQHCVAAKRYVRGRGRGAKWQVQQPFGATLAPQWRIRATGLPSDLERRISHQRAGFCDVTGQTNERTVLAAVIPPGVVCGNKVPTIDFLFEEQTYAWVGIANCFVFDWLVRRGITTTLNFFIMRNMPIPKWNENDPRLQRIANLSKLLSDSETLTAIDDTDKGLWRRAKVRAEIEVLCAQLYGISVEDLDQMLLDFPQVDREQPPIAGETASTVTRDLIVSNGYGWADPCQRSESEKRIEASWSNGAIPFLPNQHARALRRSH